MTPKQRAWHFALVCLGILACGLLMLAYAAHAHAAGTQIPLEWDGSHFATTTSTVLCPDTSSVTGFAVADYPYIPGWGFYGSGDVSPTQTVNLATQNYNIANIANHAATHGNPGLNFMLYCGDNVSGIPAGGIYYGLFDIVGGAIVPVPPPSNTTFINVLNPTQGTTTPSTTFDIDLEYNIGTDLSNFSLDGSIPDRIGIELVLQNTGGGFQTSLGIDWNIASSTGYHTYATSTSAAQADYTLIARLIGDYGFIPPPEDCSPLPPFVTCEGSGDQSILATALPAPTFSVANGTFPYLGFDSASSSSRNGLATTTCNVLQLGGCFQNALAFLFYPSPGILDQFRFLWSLIQNKPPFGYVSQTITGLRSLNASSTPAFSFGNIPLVDTIFTPFRTGLAALLWVGFFIAWYRGRLRHLDI